MGRTARSWVVPSARQPQLVVGTARFEPATSCLQSQIGQDRYLGAQGSPQVAVGLALSVVVRSGPAMTGVNGTVVARTTRTTFMGLASVGTKSTVG